MLIMVGNDMDSPLGFEDGADVWLEKRIDLGMKVVGRILAERLMVPGEVSQEFHPWTGDRVDWVERIERGWREFGTRLNISDVCWFEITPAGIERARDRYPNLREE